MVYHISYNIATKREYTMEQEPQAAPLFAGVHRMHPMTSTPWTLGWDMRRSRGVQGDAMGWM